MVPVVGQNTLSCDILKPASTTAMCATVCLADEALAVACPLAQPPARGRHARPPLRLSGASCPASG